MKCVSLTLSFSFQEMDWPHRKRGWVGGWRTETHRYKAFILYISFVDERRGHSPGIRSIHPLCWDTKEKHGCWVWGDRQDSMIDQIVVKWRRTRERERGRGRESCVWITWRRHQSNQPVSRRIWVCSWLVALGKRCIARNEKRKQQKSNIQMTSHPVPYTLHTTHTHTHKWKHFYSTFADGSFGLKVATLPSAVIELQ